MRKSICLAVVISLLFLFSSCFSYNETEGLSIVSCAALDKTNDIFDFSVMTLDFSAMSKEEVGQSKVTTAKAPTVAEAVWDVEKKLGSKLYWSHCYVFIIGSDAAYDGINRILDFLNLTNNVRINLNILVAKGSKAADFLSKKEESGGGKLKNKGALFQKVVTLNIKNNAVPAFKAYQSINSIADEKGAFILPAIEMIREEPGFSVNNSAVFSGDKLKGFCDDKYSDTVSILKNECESYIFTVSGREIGEVTAELSKIKTKISPTLKNSKFDFNVKITGIAVVREQSGGKINSREKLKTFEKAINEGLYMKLSETIAYFKKGFGIEALSFGAAAYIKNPLDYERLKYRKNPLENSEVEIESKITAKNYGTLSR